MGSGCVSHCWTSAFDDHFYHGFVILRNVKHRTKSRGFRVRRIMINITQIKKKKVLGWNLGLVFGCACLMCVTRRVSSYLTLGVLELVWGRMNHFYNKIPKIKSWSPTMRKPASREIISASVELCESDVCFLHIQLVGTNVRLPKCIRVHLMLILSLLDLLQNQSPETILICIVVLYSHVTILFVITCMMNE